MADDGDYDAAAVGGHRGKPNPNEMKKIFEENWSEFMEAYKGLSQEQKDVCRAKTTELHDEDFTVSMFDDEDDVNVSSEWNTMATEIKENLITFWYNKAGFKDFCDKYVPGSAK